MKGNRRQFIGAGAAAALGRRSLAAQPRNDDRIAGENRRAGTREWQLQYTRFDNPVTMASYPLNRKVRCSGIEGYASRTSVAPGENIDFLISLNPGGQFLIDVYRMGYYGGSGGRHMLKLGPFKAEPQPVPMMTIERLRECAWEKCTTLEIPNNWPSGVYLAKLTRDEPFGSQSYIVFVVKEHRPCDLLVMAADLTWQAYNKWPGRDSLYDDGTPEVWYTGPNVRVSFDRPYAKYCQVVDAPLSAGSGSFLLWEHPLAFWLEQHGYDVTYCSNVDLDQDPSILRTAKVLVSVGHDEYWSRNMFEQAVKARDEGLSIAFLSGNAVSGEIIFYDSSVTGAPSRAFARRRHFPDEKELMGVTSYGSGYGDWVVTKPEHWVYEGTGLKLGDKIPAVIGWEYHGAPLAEIPGLEVLASSALFPRKSRSNPDQQHSAIVYPCSKGNWVFNAGTIWWPEHLSCPPGHIPARTYSGPFGINAHIERVTSNVLNRMIQDAPRTRASRIDFRESRNRSR